ncbi:hypothetical protein V8C86DRAFT_2435316 [Haematococcus lacustris]
MARQPLPSTSAQSTQPALPDLPPRLTHPLAKASNVMLKSMQHAVHHEAQDHLASLQKPANVVAYATELGHAEALALEVGVSIPQETTSLLNCPRPDMALLSQPFQLTQPPCSTLYTCSLLAHSAPGPLVQTGQADAVLTLPVPCAPSCAQHTCSLPPLAALHRLLQQEAQRLYHTGGDVQEIRHAGTPDETGPALNLQAAATSPQSAAPPGSAQQPHPLTDPPPSHWQPSGDLVALLHSRRRCADGSATATAQRLVLAALPVDWRCGEAATAPCSIHMHMLQQMDRSMEQEGAATGWRLRLLRRQLYEPALRLEHHIQPLPAVAWVSRDCLLPGHLMAAVEGWGRAGDAAGARVSCSDLHGTKGHEPTVGQLGLWPDGLLPPGTMAGHSAGPLQGLQAAASWLCSSQAWRAALQAGGGGAGPQRSSSQPHTLPCAYDGLLDRLLALDMDLSASLTLGAPTTSTAPHTRIPWQQRPPLPRMLAHAAAGLAGSDWGSRPYLGQGRLAWVCGAALVQLLADPRALAGLPAAAAHARLSGQAVGLGAEGPAWVPPHNVSPVWALEPLRHLAWQLGRPQPHPPTQHRPACSSVRAVGSSMAGTRAASVALSMVSVRNQGQAQQGSRHGPTAGAAQPITGAPASCTAATVQAIDQQATRPPEPASPAAPAALAMALPNQPTQLLPPRQPSMAGPEGCEPAAAPEEDQQLQCPQQLQGRSSQPSPDRKQVVQAEQGSPPSHGSSEAGQLAKLRAGAESGVARSAQELTSSPSRRGGMQGEGSGAGLDRLLATALQACVLPVELPASHCQLLEVLWDVRAGLLTQLARVPKSVQVYAAVMVVTKTALLLLQHGLSQAFLYMNHMRSELPRTQQLCKTAWQELSSAYAQLTQAATPAPSTPSPDAKLVRQAGRQGPGAGATPGQEGQGQWVDHPKHGVLEELLLTSVTQGQARKVLLLDRPCALFQAYRSAINAGLQPYQLDRPAAAPLTGTTTQQAAGRSATLHSSNCLLASHAVVQQPGFQWEGIDLVWQTTTLQADKGRQRERGEQQQMQQDKWQQKEWPMRPGQQLPGRHIPSSPAQQLHQPPQMQQGERQQQRQQLQEDGKSRAAEPEAPYRASEAGAVGSAQSPAVESWVEGSAGQAVAMGAAAHGQRVLDRPAQQCGEESSGVLAAVSRTLHQRPLVVSNTPGSLLLQRPALYEAILSLEQAAGQPQRWLALEVVERPLGLVDVCLSPACCLCLWPVQLPPGEQHNVHQESMRHAVPVQEVLPEQVGDEVLSRLHVLAKAFSTVWAVVETHSALCQGVQALTARLQHTARQQYGLSLHLLTSHSPHTTQRLSLAICQAVLAASRPAPGLVPSSSGGPAWGQASGLTATRAGGAVAAAPGSVALPSAGPLPPAAAPCPGSSQPALQPPLVGLDDRPSPAEQFLCASTCLNPLSAAMLCSLHVPLGQLVQAAAAGQLPQLADQVAAGWLAAAAEAAGQQPRDPGQPGHVQPADRSPQQQAQQNRSQADVSGCGWQGGVRGQGPGAGQAAGQAQGQTSHSGPCLPADMAQVLLQCMDLAPGWLARHLPAHCLHLLAHQLQAQCSGGLPASPTPQEGLQQRTGNSNGRRRLVQQRGCVSPSRPDQLWVVHGGKGGAGRKQQPWLCPARQVTAQPGWPGQQARPAVGSTRQSALQAAREQELLQATGLWEEEEEEAEGQEQEQEEEAAAVGLWAPAAQQATLQQGRVTGPNQARLPWPPGAQEGASLSSVFAAAPGQVLNRQAQHTHPGTGAGQAWAGHLDQLAPSLSAGGRAGLSRLGPSQNGVARFRDVAPRGSRWEEAGEGVAGTYQAVDDEEEDLLDTSFLAAPFLDISSSGGGGGGGGGVRRGMQPHARPQHNRLGGTPDPSLHSALLLPPLGTSPGLGLSHLSSSHPTASHPSPLSPATGGGQGLGGWGGGRWLGMARAGQASQSERCWHAYLQQPRPSAVQRAAAAGVRAGGQ